MIVPIIFQVIALTITGLAIIAGIRIVFNYALILHKKLKP